MPPPVSTGRARGIVTLARSGLAERSPASVVSAHRRDRTTMGFCLTRPTSGTVAGSRPDRPPTHQLRPTHGGSLASKKQHRGPTSSRILSSKYRDATGLVDCGYRYYSPSLGRWLSQDPIRDDAFSSFYVQNAKEMAEYLLSYGTQQNPTYLFAGNGPASRLDIKGLFFPVPPGSGPYLPPIDWYPGIPRDWIFPPVTTPPSDPCCDSTDVVQGQEWSFLLNSIGAGGVTWREIATGSLHAQDAIRTCLSASGGCPAGHVWMCKGFVGHLPRGPIGSEAHGACYRCEGSCLDGLCWKVLSHRLGAALEDAIRGPTGIRKEFWWEDCGCTD
jgi:RHS repeat-associated protein